MTKVKTDTRPLYILVKERIEELVNDGTFVEGDRLPSENTLAEELGVSRATLREALRVLEEEKKVIRQQGVGTFISKRMPKIQNGLEDLYSVTETIRSHGFEPGTTGYTISEEKMGKHAAVFGHDPEDMVWMIERIRTANHEPVVYCQDRLPQKYFPEPLDIYHDGADESLFMFMERQLQNQISYAVTRILPISAPEWLAEKMHLAPGSPVLLLEQKHYEMKDRMVLFSRNYFRPDKFEFYVVRRRR